MSDDSARLAAALGERFTVVRELGRGGMATVYLARDVKHGRLVAVKVLSPDIAAALGAERFLREIHIAANLNHPHIVALYDSGIADGLLYYMMPYVEGESLRDRLRRTGPLPVAEALRLARDVAGALAYAHAQGVVHRDIKPENILLQAGHAMVTDFGIARAVTAAGAPGLTASGIIVGTPLYMSPEQIAGDAVDGRSDLYSLGCVLYEMLTGAPPYGGPSSLEVLSHHAASAVPSVRRSRAGVSPDVERAVARALAKLPAQRQASADVLDAELAAATPPARRSRARWTVWTALSLVVIAIGTGYAVMHGRRGSGEKSIAVLPLVSEGATQDDSIRADGMTEALIDALSRVSGLRVASRMSVFAFQRAGLDSRSMGARLGVATLLETSMQRAGGVLQVSVRLVSADDGYVIWSQAFRRDQQDVFAVQDEISQAVVRALQVRLVGGPRPLVQPTTENVAAYDLYLRGRWYWNQRAAGSRPLYRAIEFFNRAIALDSNYARAWAGLADAYSLVPAFGEEPPANAFPEAKRAAQRALGLDSGLAEVHTSLGIISVFHDWDWATADREFKRALAIDSTEPRAHLFQAWYLVAQGRLVEALDAVETAQRLNPTSAIINTRLGSALYFLHRYDDAATQLRRAIALDSTNLGARAELARVLVQQRRFADALAALPDIFDLQAGHLGGGVVAYVDGAAGRREDARATLRRLEQRARERYIDPEAFAMAALGVGDTALALDWLERGVRDRSFYLPFVAADPVYEPLHRNARFRKIVQTVGLRFPPDSAR